MVQPLPLLLLLLRLTLCSGVGNWS